MDEIATSCAADLRALCPHGADDDLEQTAARLAARWCEATTGTPGLQHLAQTLAALGAVAATGALTPRDLLVARVGGWYHQGALVDGGSDDAAALAIDDLGRLGAEIRDVERVAEMVVGASSGEPTDDPACEALIAAVQHATDSSRG